LIFASDNGGGPAASSSANWILLNARLEQPAMYRQLDMRSTACKFKRVNHGAQDNPFR